jgi:glucose/mannose-6-phosphate isomerase
MATDGYAAMLHLVLGLPAQLTAALEAATRVVPLRMKRPSTVVVAGMGGSAIGGDVARCILQETAPVPIVVCRDYRLPGYCGQDTLLFAVSYSGNTEETLAAYANGVRRSCRTMCVTSGGALLRETERRGHPVCRVPAGLPPRAAIGYLTLPLLVSLGRLGFCRNVASDVRSTVKLLVRRRRAMQVRSRRLAGLLLNRLPVVYSTSRLLDVAADRWRCQLNENAKVLCHTSVLPEHNHNEIVGMGSPVPVARSTAIVTLRDRETHRRTRLRYRLLLDIVRGTYGRAVEIASDGRSRLERLFSLIMLGDLVSVELARLRRVDPMGVERIDELKRRLAARSAD